jgi:hypothetical protein
MSKPIAVARRGIESQGIVPLRTKPMDSVERKETTTKIAEIEKVWKSNCPEQDILTLRKKTCE